MQSLSLCNPFRCAISAVQSLLLCDPFRCAIRCASLYLVIPLCNPLCIYLSRHSAVHLHCVCVFNPGIPSAAVAFIDDLLPPSAYLRMTRMTNVQSLPLCIYLYLIMLCDPLCVYLSYLLLCVYLSCHSAVRLLCVCVFNPGIPSVVVAFIDNFALPPPLLSRA